MILNSVIIILNKLNSHTDPFYTSDRKHYEKEAILTCITQLESLLVNECNISSEENSPYLKDMPEKVNILIKKVKHYHTH